MEFEFVTSTACYYKQLQTTTNTCAPGMQPGSGISKQTENRKTSRDIDKYRQRYGQRQAEIQTKIARDTRISGVKLRDINTKFDDDVMSTYTHTYTHTHTRTHTHTHTHTHTPQFIAPEEDSTIIQRKHYNGGH